MKKSKFFKILAPIVSLGLLVGALVGINVQAAEVEASTPEIISMNVEYGSELYLLYAVDKSTVAGTPALEIVNADGTEVISTVSEYSETTVNGVACYVFKTSGFAPGQLNKAEYVRAVGENGAGAVVKYSIEDYLYTRLYKNGFAAKTAADGKDYDKRNLYFWTLEYGKSAQEVFYSDDADKIGNPGIAIKGNSAASGECAVGECVVLSADGIVGFDYWLVTEMTAFGEVIGTRKLGAGYECLMANSLVAIPVTDDDAAEGVEAWDPSVITFNKETNSGFRGNTSAYVTIGREFDAEEGNWYYSITKVAGGGGSFYVYPTAGDVNTASEIVVEFDFFAGGTVAKNWQFHMPTSTTTSSAYKYSPFIDTHSGSFKAIVLNQWNHVKIVYAPVIDEENGSTFTVSIYVNDMVNPEATINTLYGASLNGQVPAISAINRFEFDFNGSCTGEYKIDNVSFVYR